MSDNSETNNYRARRMYTYRHIEALCAIVDALGENDPSRLHPILPPEEGLPPTPSDCVKREMKNQLYSTMRLILAHNDGSLAPAEMQRY